MAEPARRATTYPMTSTEKGSANAVTNWNIERCANGEFGHSDKTVRPKSAKA